MGKKKVTLSLDDKIYRDFQKYCNDNAIMLSKKIELVMKSIIENKGKKGLLILIFTFIMMSIIINVNASVFQDKIQSDFSGNYFNTSYNLDGIILNGSNLTGSYISKIFDAGSIANWNNLSFAKNSSSLEYYYIVDTNAGFWKSNNTGYNWSSINIDYNGADSNSADSLRRNSSNSLFIMNGQSLWVSNDYGISWIKINNDYNGAETYQDSVFSVDRNNNIIIVDTNEQIWKSTNSGNSFTKINNSFSGGSSNAFGISINSSNAYFVVDGLSDVWSSIDSGNNWIKVNDDYNGGGVPNGGNSMDSNSTGSLYIVDGQDIWISNDQGITWIKVNDDFNGVETYNAKFLYIDSKNNIFIPDTSEAIYFSNDYGVTFTKLTDDMNGVNGDVSGIVSLTLNSSLNFQIKNCTSSDCSDGTYINANINNINLTSRYFQYKSIFLRQDPAINLKLYNISIDYTILDNVPPNFTNQIENPNNSSLYNLGQIYRFNISVGDINLKDVGIQFNGVNYSGASFISNISGVYMFNRTNQAAGTYGYYWWANDSIGNFNKTILRYYTINKTSTQVSLTFDKTSPQNYLTTITPTCSLISGIGTPTLFLDGNIISSGNPVILGAGNHLFNCSLGASQNYSNSENLSSFTINKGNPFVNMQITGTTPITYGTDSDFIGSETNEGDSDCVYTLDKNNQIYSAGTIIFNYSTNGCSNYTSGSTTKNLIIEKADNSLFLSSSVGWSTISYGTQADFECTSVFGIPLLYIDNIEETNPITIELSVGSHNIKCNISDSENYTSETSQGTLTVNKASSTTNVIVNPNSPIYYGNTSNFSCSNSLGLPTTMTINGIDKTNEEGLNIIRSAGNYNINCSYIGNSNFTSSSEQRSYTINKENSQTLLTFDKTSPQNFGTTITPTCSLISGVGTPVLYLNGNIISSGNPIILGAGNHLFNCSLETSQNYTISENVSSFAINKASSITNVIVNPNSPIYYGNTSNFSCSNSLGLPTTMTINGIDKTNEEGLNIIRSTGNYNINCSYIGNSNYTSSSEQTSFTINKIPVELSLLLNGNENDVTIDYPEQYNISSSTIYGNITLFMNGVEITSDNGKIKTPERISKYYNITAYSSGDENHSTNYLTRWLNVTLDEVPPVIIINSPQDGDTYGYNSSIKLNYSIYDDHQTFCWYNINNGINISLINCENTTFNVSNDGSYIINLYSNDSLGNVAEISSSFSVLVGSPTITLISPIGVYFNDPNITFRYIPSDMDLQSCELWGNFSGNFEYNQTDISPINNNENLFELFLQDGMYKWNVKCNDSLGHTAFNGNKTFHVDTIKPKINIIEPTGNKNSWIDIPFSFSLIDNSPLNCKYNVNWAIGGNVIPNTTIPNCIPSKINLSSVGDYVINLYVTDFAGNFNSSSTSFRVSDTGVVTPPENVNHGGGGGGGGGISTVNKNITKINESMPLFSFTNIGNIISKQGEKKTLSISIKNIGKVFLNNCKILFKGDVSKWFYSKQVDGIAPGENKNFMFDLNVPEGIEQKEYSGELSISCDEKIETQELKVILPKSSYNLDIKEVKQEGDKLFVVYEFNSSEILDNKISVDAWLVNQDNIEEKRTKDLFNLEKNGIIERKVEIDVKDMIGVYNLYLSFSDNLNNPVKQSVVLGKNIATGYSVLDQPGNKMIAYVFFIFIIFIAVFLIVFGIRKKKSGVVEKRNIKNWF